MTYLLASALFIIYLILAWFVGAWLHLVAPSIWILRGLLALIGIVGLSFYIWFNRKKRSEKEDTEERPGFTSNEIDVLFHEANGKLSSSPNAPGRIANLPLVLVLGETGSVKTSTILNCGLRPELLAGQAQSGAQVVPTKLANLWLAGPAIFLEAGGPLLKDSGLWQRLVDRVKPRKLSSVVSGKSLAPRAVIVCFDSETFLTPQANEAVASAARTLRARLGELSKALGSEIPVYVLFTRLDRVPFFTDFVTQFTEPEARQVFGTTLPLTSGGESGVWAERQTARITDAYEELAGALANMRPETLSRENDRGKRPGIYEFPREFRKVKKLAVEFLVELCRPSQLATGPFLRGFYFSGIRPVTVTDPAPAYGSPAGIAPEPVFASDATSIFRAPAPSTPEVMRPTPRGSRRVPEWTFLPELFSDVILRDQGASALSGASVKASGLRRALLAAITIACLFLLAACTISWWRNRAMEQQVEEAVRGISVSQPAPGAIPSADALRRLDNLRALAETLSSYRRDGAPLSYRWGLYNGDNIYPHVRTIYFAEFRQLLFGQTQASLVQSLRDLPATPGPDYGSTYDILKAYLITTSNGDRSVRSFLSPLLLKRWAADRGIDTARLQLAHRQFDFYADELRYGNPYSTANDNYVVTKARKYLGQFAGPQRVYRAMLAEAANASPPIEFNTKFPGSAAALVDTHEVSGAFTKAGWAFMSKAIANPGQYFAGEQWVLGDQASANLDPARLEQQLHELYSTDMIGQWRAYLKAASFLRYTSIADAAHKLNLIAGNQSPLLELLSLASQNTAVKDSALTAAFQPVQAVVPPKDDDQLISPANQTYMQALLTLQSSVEQLSAQNPPSDAGEAQVLSDAAKAKVTTKLVAQGFRADVSGRVDGLVQKLMEDPITQVEGLLKVLGPAQLNGNGKGLCAQMRSLWLTYPFSPNSPNDASEAQINTFFRKPDGAIWTFYDQNLQKLLLPQGTQYIPNPTAQTKVTPGFLHFFNAAAAVSNLLYSGGSQEPKFTYTLTPVQSEGIEQLGLTIDGQTLTYSSGVPSPKTFTWQAGGPHEVKATIRLGGGGTDLTWATYQGTWAVFHFFNRAELWQPNGTKYVLERTIRIGSTPAMLPNGKPLIVRFDLDMGGAPPILKPGFFSGITCTAEVAR